MKIVIKIVIAVQLIFLTVGAIQAAERDPEELRMLAEILQRLERIDSRLERLEEVSSSFRNLTVVDQISENTGGDSVPDSSVLEVTLDDESANELYKSAIFAFFGDTDRLSLQEYDLTEEAFNNGMKILSEFKIKYPELRVAVGRLEVFAEGMQSKAFAVKHRIYIDEFKVALDPEKGVLDKDNPEVKVLRGFLAKGLDSVFNLVNYVPGKGRLPEFGIKSSVLAEDDGAGGVKYVISIERFMMSTKEVRIVQAKVEDKASLGSTLEALAKTINRGEEVYTLYCQYDIDLEQLKVYESQDEFKNLLQLGKKMLALYQEVRSDEELIKLKEYLEASNLRREQKLSWLYDKFDNRKRVFLNAVKDRDIKKAKMSLSDLCSIRTKINRSGGEVDEIQKQIDEFKSTLKQ